MPVARLRRRHRNDAEAVGILEVAPARGEEDAAEDEREAHDQDGDERSEHDAPEHRRPLEQQEGADAAEPKIATRAKPKASRRPIIAQPLRHGRKGMGADPGARPRRGAPENLLGAEAEGDEGSDQQDEAGHAAPCRSLRSTVQAWASSCGRAGRARATRRRCACTSR